MNDFEKYGQPVRPDYRIKLNSWIGLAALGVIILAVCVVYL